MSSPPATDPSDPGAPVPVPSHAALAELLDAHAPLRPAPLCPELKVFRARQLIGIWEAAERLAGRPMPAPFWAYPWPGGAALARILLDRPFLARGRRVLDLGAGGGVSALAAAYAGAREVVANDIDPWAVGTARLAAERQGVHVTPLLGDLTEASDLPEFDLLLCGDLAYERRSAPRLRAFLDRARRRGAAVMAADAGRAYFDADGLTHVAAFTVPVPQDLEGTERRTARVFAWP